MTAFQTKTRLGDVSNMEEAIRSYYKRSRIPDDVSGLVAYGERWLKEEGDTCIASCHESRTGVAIWGRMENGRLAVYEG